MLTNANRSFGRKLKNPSTVLDILFLELDMRNNSRKTNYIKDSFTYTEELIISTYFLLQLLHFELYINIYCIHISVLSQNKFHSPNIIYSTLKNTDFAPSK